ncbi:MAG: PEP-CTERM sorting domain-containing protein [Isosphaeraceae bacterium]
MTRFRVMLALALGMATLVGARSASADLILSTNSTSYTTTVGGTVDVVVLLSQNGTLPQINASNGLLAYALTTTFNSPSGVAAVTSTANVFVGTLFDGGTASTGITATTASVAATATDFVFGVTSLNPAVVLATFRFSGLSVGSTTITIGPVTPGNSFVSINNDIANPAAVTATIRVNAIPEPSSWTMGMLGGFGVAGGLFLRRRFAPSIA